jgi:kinetochore protein Spc24
MAPIIDPEEDYLSIVGAEEKIAATQTKRKKELDESQAHLKGMLELFAPCHLPLTQSPL